nr:SHOCT domain-containing protein [Lactococcus lactis]
MTRLVALGVFAFAAKKKKGGEKYLTIEGPDFVWTTEVKRDKKDIDKAMKFINQINTNSKIYSKSMQITSSTTSIADELKKFKELLDSGAITQEEFEIQKSKLLK